MLLKRLSAVRTVAASLLACEDAIDTALQASSRLNGEMVQARKSAGLSALYGQEALEEAISAQMALAEARRRIVQAHLKLSIVKHDIGLDVYAAGDGAPKPPMPVVPEGQDNHQAVA